MALAALSLWAAARAADTKPSADAQKLPAAQDAESDRLELIFSLERKPAPSQIQILLDTLGHNASANARAEAARALAIEDYRKPYALDALTRAMADDASAQVRRRAALSALSYEGHEAVAPLQDFLKNERAAELRREVAVALATAPLHLDDSEATAALAAMAVDDQDPENRQAAARALGERGDRRALAALKQLAEKDPEKLVRRAARDAIARLEPVRKRRPSRDQRQDARDDRRR